MSEYPECPICLDIYGINENHIKAPKMIDCGHSFCKECLEKIIKKSSDNFLLCPYCNRSVEKKNVNDYITNLQLIQLINSSFRLPEIKEENLEENKKPITYRIIILGYQGVGKTSIFKRLLNEKFATTYKNTINPEIYIPYFVKYKGIKYKLFFCDTAGQERFIPALPKNYLRQSDGVLFVFDLSNKESFDKLELWYDLYKREKEKIVGVILGNKCDICDEERQVNYDEAKSFANNLELKYFETSAKLDKKIKKSIAILLEEIIESKVDYNSLKSINTDGDKFRLEPIKFKKENFWEKFCYKLNPINWFRCKF